MIPLSIDLTLPIADPVIKFFLVLIIILAAPLLLNKIKVPHIIGLIIAGAVIGPNGFNVLPRDSSIVVIGTTGLLYIMFTAGLEIDLGDLNKNKWKSLYFGLLTFAFPFALGFLGAEYILGYSDKTSILFASLFSSHTLVAYPLVSKLGIVKNRAVNITVGGTMITDVLALLVLAAIVGMTKGEVNNEFWIKMGVSFFVFAAVVLFGFPIIARWVFKKVKDSVSQYIFILVMIYLAAVLADIAGVEGIIGAFFAGLALNRLVPHTSSLMTHIDFVGNALFIPFFLISVGMLIDFKVFFTGWETILVTAVMIVASFGGKYLAAKATQKTFRFRDEEGKIIFGLSSASAAATLAVVLVGYNIILSEDASGQPIRLLNEHILNASILLILISCTLSSFITQSSAEKIAESENEDAATGDAGETEIILMAVNHQETVEPLVDLALITKSKKNTDNLYALNIINEDKNESSIKNAEKILGEAVTKAAAADVKITPLTRHDNDLINGVNNTVKENMVSDLFLALEQSKGFSNTFNYNLYNGYLHNRTSNIFIYHAAQPVSTIKKQKVIIPANMDTEPGFFHSLLRVWNIARNTGAVLTFYSTETTSNVLKRIIKRANIEAKFEIINSWNEAKDVILSVKEDEGLILFMAKRGMNSYIPQMMIIPDLMNTNLNDRNYLIIYPYQGDPEEYSERTYLGNHRDFSQISNVVRKLFK